MTGYTAGPLQIVEAKTLDNFGQWHIYLAAPDGRKIAALWGAQKIGNAHLFAAASAMLGALRKIASCEKRADGDVVDIARTAIAKATGAVLSSAATKGKDR